MWWQQNIGKVKIISSDCFNQVHANEFESMGWDGDALGWYKLVKIEQCSRDF